MDSTGIENNELEPEEFEDNSKENYHVMIAYDEVEKQAQNPIPDIPQFTNIIRYSDDHNRTLNQLKDEISNLLKSELITFSELTQIQYYLLLKRKSKRCCSDFFVASLRSIGQISEQEAVKFGREFLSLYQDHRDIDFYFITDEIPKMKRRLI